PGVHFVSAQEGDLPLVLDGLFADKERLHQIRHAAYDLVRKEMPMSRATEVIERAVEKAYANPLNLGRVGPGPAAPMPKRRPLPPPGWVSYADSVGEQLPTRRALMDLVTRNRHLERLVEELAEGAGAADEVTVEEFGPGTETKPRISVLLTVYNHAELAPLAL